MKVILREDVDNLGSVGSIVNVSDGYGRNYLIPRNLAVEADPRNVNKFEHEKKQILARIEKIKKSADELAVKLSGIKLAIEAQVGEEGKLFGSITTMDIAKAISKHDIAVDRRKILIHEPIKRIGTYNVSIKLHPEVTANLTLEVKRAE